MLKERIKGGQGTDMDGVEDHAITGISVSNRRLSGVLAIRTSSAPNDNEYDCRAAAG